MAKASLYQSRILFLRTNVFFREKTVNLPIFCTLGKRLSHVGRKRSGSFVEFALYVTRKSFWKKVFLEKNCLQLFFRLWAKRFLTFSGLSRHAFHKIHFSFLEQNVGVKNCLKNKGVSFLSQFCVGGFRNSDKDVESVFSQLP